MSRQAFEIAKRIFRQNNGILRTSEALQLGIAPSTLYHMRDAGEIVRMNRGLFYLAEDQPPKDFDLMQVALLVPRAIICLISALAYFDLTTQIPHRVWIALPRSSQRPRLAYPQLEVVWLPHGPYQAGMEVHTINGKPVRIYSREKTLADCFRYENRVGKDVVLEALKEYKRQGDVSVENLMKFARIDRVEEKIKPYLEAIL